MSYRQLRSDANDLENTDGCQGSNVFPHKLRDSQYEDIMRILIDTVLGQHTLPDTGHGKEGKGYWVSYWLAS
jgi:hypothetical protein